MTSAELAKARARIDDLDRQLQQLISDRARVAQQIREIKARGGGAGDHYRPAREAEVLRRAIARNEGPLSDEVVARLMREIMSACLALESPLKVAYLGPEGTYTQAAVYKHFGHAVEARAAAAIDEIFRDVESGAATYGVVPIENSTEGVVSSTLDLLAHTPLSICGEVWLPVHHFLLSKQKRAQVKKIYAHAQSLAQCRKWLDAKLPDAERIAVASNGLAAQMVKKLRRGAAIAGQAAAELYGLDVLASNIEDDPNNTTRFLVIGRQNPEPTGRDMTSLVMSAHKSAKPGALFELLEPLKQAGISMTKIESRPSRRAAWDYNFFIDFEGHQDDAKIKPTLDLIQSRAAYFRLLGSYPRAAV